MQIVKQGSIGPQEAAEAMAEVLRKGGLVCLPCNGTYRILADLQDSDAVLRLLQSKRRVHKAPSLVFVDRIEGLKEITEQVNEEATAIMKQFWPGPVTILFEASSQLPRKISKELTRANGCIGVRIPEEKIARDVVKAFGKPLLVSSANKGKKAGESSPAQVRQSFLGRVDYFYDAGDLAPEPSSTVIGITKTGIEVVRKGAVSEEVLRAALG